MSAIKDFYITQCETIERVADNLKINAAEAVVVEDLVLPIRAAIKILQTVLSNLDPAGEFLFKCGECTDGQKYSLNESPLLAGRVSVFSDGSVEFFCLDHE